jgi:uncharacterized membrane protein YbhN (UPF0104 family)
VLKVGAGPFVDGLRSTGPLTVLVALVVTAGTTWCCAVRWSLLAERLDVPVAVGAAYRACYRAQLLNSVLPGGVLGDVHRGVRHGRDNGALGRGVRSVAWDRVSGQVVQGTLTVVAALLLPASVTTVVLGAAAVAAALVVAAFALPGRAGRALRREVRRVPAASSVWPRVVALSALAATGHVVVFVVAARAAGVDASLTELVPIGFVVMTAAAVPLNVAGWGPREGAAAWVFAAAGLGTAAGVEVAVTYGVVALVATLPGVLVLRTRQPAAPDHRELVEAARG